MPCKESRSCSCIEPVVACYGALCRGVCHAFLIEHHAYSIVLKQCKAGVTTISTIPWQSSDLYRDEQRYLLAEVTVVLYALWCMLAWLGQYREQKSLLAAQAHEVSNLLEYD